VNTDPRETLLISPMGPLQIVVVALTVALNALDGFDVMSISFASPGIAAEWHTTNTALGVVLSMELIGMALGSIVLGALADRIGRRPTLLACLVLMTAGMFLATTAAGPVDLSVWRVLTGFGIGGVLAAVNAVAAEFASTRMRHLAVSLMSIGYPVGAVLGGLVVKQLLVSHGWRAVFYFGAGFTAVLIPLVFILVPESVHWLVKRRPAGALARVNRIMARLGHAAVDALPAPDAAGGGSIADIFAPALLATTIILSVAYFLHVVTFYFILKWVPKIVVNMGFPASKAAGVLVWENVGGALGGALFGLATLRFGVKRLTIVVMVLSTAGVIAFGRSPADLGELSLACAVTGFFANAGIVGMYAIFAQAYPTQVRAFGTGWAIGIGRGGAWLAPVFAGMLFDGGHSVATVATIMALGSLAAAAVVGLLRLGPAAAEMAGTASSPARAASA